MALKHRPTTSRIDQSIWAIFIIFLRLGLTSFGGPIAHLSYFRAEFVVRRGWLSERSYADLVALCQFLPGPASSQVGIALGLTRGGYAGALAAWLGFTLPSVVALILFALGMAQYGHLIAFEVLGGLKIVAVAVVAQAVWGMGQKLCTDGFRVTIMVIAACWVLLVATIWAQLSAILVAGIVGWLRISSPAMSIPEQLSVSINRRASVSCLGLFFTLLLGLPILSQLVFEQAWLNQSLAMVDGFYRAGALVFGGGHVVLPLLQAEVVPPGWVDNNVFLAGYGAAQAVPGPLFSFAAFLGASFTTAPNGWLGALLALVAIYAPAFLLVVGALPYWERLRASSHMQAALAGINAAVVGLLLAALYDPVWTSAIYRPQDFALALLALIALVFWKLPPWLVVIGGGLAAWLW